MKSDILPKNKFNCPYLFLAPMEGLGDRSFRKAMNSIGGFDEAVTEFLRVPTNGHVKSLARRYEADELLPTPLAAQIMGSDVTLMADMAAELEKRGAPRIDINCGCPSNIVTGRGAGSSLLKDPEFLHQVARSVVQAVSVPVTIKMRSGFDDTALFSENVLAAEASGVRFITLHPRTKQDGYGPPAKWELIARAKALLKIPLVGNGDILTVEDGCRMLQETGCDALMIGRGAAMNPFIFQQIQAHFSGIPFLPTYAAIERFIHIFVGEIPVESPLRGRLNKMKQLFSFLLRGDEEARRVLLTNSYDSFESFLDFGLKLLKRLYQH